jgi:hypothetical protein
VSIKRGNNVARRRIRRKQTRPELPSDKVPGGEGMVKQRDKT